MSEVDNAVQKQSPLLVFVHIPKTAGSTVNDCLAKSGLVGQDHIEQWITKAELARERVKSLDWVSGHCAFPSARAFFANITPRHMRFFSTYRDPIKQILSHYNWLIEIFHRGEKFYENHPPIIKRISETIRASDNNNVLEVISNLKAFPGLFLNQQSRVLIGEDCQTLSTDQILERMKVYEFIATESQLPVLLAKMLGSSLEELPYENQSQYHFDPAVFRAPEMQEFLLKHHQVDMVVYDLLMKLGGRFPALGQTDA